MSLRKFHNEMGGAQHGGAQLSWPGTPEGFPVINRSGQADLKQDEVESLDLRLDFKSKMFELWDSAQKAEFDDINDKIVNGWYLLQKRSDNWDDEHKHYRVWLEWSQIYGMIPPTRQHT